VSSSEASIEATDFVLKGMDMRVELMLLAGLCACLLAAPAGAAGVYDPGLLSFSTSDQSMWGSSDAFVYDGEIFFGTEWDSKPKTVISSGASHLDLGSRGKVGLGFGLEINSGSVDALTSYGAKLSLPDKRGLGQLVSLNSSCSVKDGSLSTTFPHFNANMYAVAGLEFYGSFSTPYIDTSKVWPWLWTTETYKATIDPIGLAPTEIPLLSIEAPPGQISILGGWKTYGLPDTFSVDGMLDVSVNIPRLDTVGGPIGGVLFSTDREEMLEVALDLDGLLTKAVELGLTVAGMPLDLPGMKGEVEFWPITFEYDLFNVQAGPYLDLEQRFWCESALMVELEFSDPVKLASGEIVNCVEAPWGSLPDIAPLSRETWVTPTFYVDGTLKNMTSLYLGGMFSLSALDVEFGLNFGPVKFAWDPDPLWQKSWNKDLARIDVFNSQFGLGGFNHVVGQAFMISASPEPGTFALLGLGLVGLVCLRRRSLRR
jgi:PEP-CTERM motif